MIYEGVEQYRKGDYDTAFEYYAKAAGSGSADAHYRLAGMYHGGQGVEKDMGKQTHHLEEAAIGGHPHARYILGCNEIKNNGNVDRAVKHFIISAAQGEDNAIKMLMNAFKEGCLSKEELLLLFVHTRLL